MDRLEDSQSLYLRLEALELLHGAPPMWWPGYGTFEVVIGAILTQNSRWEKVEASLTNLRALKALSLKGLLALDREAIAEAILPSGLYNQKASRLYALVRAMKESYADFENFQSSVQRSWLLEQKGIGFESADAILCYACKRPVMVVDSYTAKLLGRLGWEFESYEAIQSWLESGISERDPEIRHAIFAKLHGMIVENGKRKLI